MGERVEVVKTQGDWVLIRLFDCMGAADQSLV